MLYTLMSVFAIIVMMRRKSSGAAVHFVRMGQNRRNLPGSLISVVGFLAGYLFLFLRCLSPPVSLLLHRSIDKIRMLITYSHNKSSHTLLYLRAYAIIIINHSLAEDLKLYLCSFSGQEAETST
jgi:hypothetical protein